MAEMRSLLVTCGTFGLFGKILGRLSIYSVMLVANEGRVAGP